MNRHSALRPIVCARRNVGRAIPLHEHGVIPVAVPLVPIDFARLRSFVQTYCEQCAFTRNSIRYVAFYARKPYLDGKLALHCAQQTSPLINGHTRYDWDPAFKEAFPETVEWFSCLPLRRLNGVVLTTQTADIPDHVDIYGGENSCSQFARYRHVEPKNYRAILTAPGDDLVRSRAFYVTQSYGGERRYVRLPRETNTFALSSSVCYHGSTHHPGHHKTTLVIHGFLDEARHLNLLRRSLKVFGEYTITFTGAGPATGPAAEWPYKGVHDR